MKRANGEIILDLTNHFLRDDSIIQAYTTRYSLFQKNPYERIYVYNGPKPWAITNALQHIDTTEYHI